MELSNRDRIDRGLAAVENGLGPYVLRELKGKYGDRWRDVVADKLDVVPNRHLLKITTSETDFLEAAGALELFRLMMVCYNEVFRDKLGHSGRYHISELWEVRNEWVMRRPFSVEDTQRALDTMVRLLSTVSADSEAEEVQKYRDAVLRQLLEFDEWREAKPVTREGEEGGASEQRRASDSRRVGHTTYETLIEAGESQ